MKKYFGFPLFAIVAFGLIAFAAFKPLEIVNEEFDISSSPIYAPSVTADTITDTEADTISISSRLYSKWSYSYMITGDELSGTISLILAIDESNTDSGSDWVEVARDTMSTDGGYLQVNGAVVNGKRQRMRVIGIGTQSSTYDVFPIFKKE